MSVVPVGTVHSHSLHCGKALIFVEICCTLVRWKQERERETDTAEESLVHVWSCEFDVFLLYKTRSS